MKKVVIQYDEKVKFFSNVTKVRFYNNGLFDSYMEICQGEKKTKIETYDILGFEVIGA